MLATVPTMTADDAASIVASLTSPTAFGAVFERHFDAIHHFLRARVGASLAEELASETFAKAFGARAQYDDAYPDAGPWLFAIANNLVRGHRRAEARRLAAYARVDAAGVQGAAEQDAAAGRVDAAMRGPALASALQRLSEPDREALLLFAWADLTYDEIARALEIPVGTVRSRLNRARNVVRAALDEAEGGS